ncbi:MAG: hypothetical protein Sylvanvirus14_23, partial [Sylvanvirus sp.]
MNSADFVTFKTSKPRESLISSTKPALELKEID